MRDRPAGDQNPADVLDGAIVPLFALPDLILFPGMVQPLHVFEPRYLQMMGDVIDGAGRIVIGTVLGDDQRHLSDEAPVQAVAGLGRVMQYERLDDGRYVLLLAGVARVRIRPAPSTRLYPKVALQPFLEQTGGGQATDSLRAWVRQALGELSTEAVPRPEEVPLTQLVDLLLLHLQLTPASLYQAFAEPSLDRRACLALDWRKQQSDDRSPSADATGDSTG